MTNYKRISFFYAIEQTIFIRKREATNYFRLMTLPVDQSDAKQVSAYLVMRNILGYGETFRSETEISLARGLGGQ